MGGARQVLALPLLAFMAGCAAPTPHRVTVEPPALPPPLVSRMATGAGLAMPPALAELRLETRADISGTAIVWIHEIGPALTAGLRSALGTLFDPLIDWPPSPAVDTAPAALVIELGDPDMTMVLPRHSVLSLYRAQLGLDLRLRWPDGAAAAATRRVEGSVSVGAHGPLFTRQDVLDRHLLRSLLAGVIAAIDEEPALARLRLPSATDVQAPETAGPARDPLGAPAAPNGVVAIRLDAGLPRDDGIERRVAECLMANLPVPPGLRLEQPAAALRDALFPWLDPGVAPVNASAVQARLAQPRIAQRLAQLGVAQLVIFSVDEIPRESSDHFGCAGGFGVGACFGWAEQRTGYRVSLGAWDVAGARLIAEEQATVRQRLGVVGAILPVPYFHSTAAQACERMQGFVRTLLPDARPR
ncbi:MAG: hypothetical protein WCG13_11310 [Burkholderiales bacterium]